MYYIVFPNIIFCLFLRFPSFYLSFYHLILFLPLFLSSTIPSRNSSALFYIFPLFLSPLLVLSFFFSFFPTFFLSHTLSSDFLSSISSLFISLSYFSPFAFFFTLFSSSLLHIFCNFFQFLPLFHSLSHTDTHPLSLYTSVLIHIFRDIQTRHPKFHVHSLQVSITCAKQRNNFQWPNIYMQNIYLFIHFYR